jgi:TRAP-type transport system periplasmic protein
MMESAYLAQIAAQYAMEASLVNTVGFSDPQLPDTIFAQNGTKAVMLNDDARREAEEMCSPEFVPGPWEQWRERINNWAGGIDTYSEIHAIAREVPRDMLAENVEPRRWWRG